MFGKHIGFSIEIQEWPYFFLRSKEFTLSLKAKQIQTCSKKSYKQDFKISS